MVSCIVIELSALTTLGLVLVSVTAPASISSWGVAIMFTVLVFVALKSNVIESVPFAVIILLDRVTPPDESPVFRMCNLEASCTFVFRDSLKCTCIVPFPVKYSALTKEGGVVSCLVIALSALAAIWLLLVSVTAPASISSWGVTMSFTVPVSVSLKSNVIELVPFAVIIPLDRVTPPDESLAFRMCILEASCAAVFKDSSKFTRRVPFPS